MSRPAGAPVADLVDHDAGRAGLPGRRRLVHHGRALWIAPGWRDRLQEVGLDATRDWLALRRGEIVRDSRHVRVRRLPLPGGAVVYLKTVDEAGKPPWTRLRIGRTLAEAINLARLAELGIPTLTPIAVGEHRRVGLLRSGCLITLEAPGRPLDELARASGPTLPARVRQAAIDQTLRYLRIAHEAGFYHRDLKWRNILVELREDAVQTRWYDCPRGGPMWGGRGRVADLSALSREAILHLRRSERYRFLRRYLGPRATRASVRRLWRAIERHRDRRGRRGRPGHAG